MSQSQQSPINLQPSITSTVPLNLKYHWKWQQGTQVYGSHGLRIKFVPSGDNYVELGGKKFLLVNAHFHSPSEHLLDSKAYDAELHIVNRNLDDLSYLVFGVFIQKLIGARTSKDEKQEKQKKQNAAIGKFRTSLKKDHSTVELNPDSFIPLNAKNIIRYEGSLTTPPFLETVSWAIFDKPLGMNDEEISEIFPKPCENARDLQPINRRYVANFPIVKNF